RAGFHDRPDLRRHCRRPTAARNGRLRAAADAIGFRERGSTSMSRISMITVTRFSFLLLSAILLIGLASCGQHASRPVGTAARSEATMDVALGFRSRHAGTAAIEAELAGMGSRADEVWVVAKPTPFRSREARREALLGDIPQISQSFLGEDTVLDERQKLILADTITCGGLIGVDDTRDEPVIVPMP